MSGRYLSWDRFFGAGEMGCCAVIQIFLQQRIPHFNLTPFLAELNLQSSCRTHRFFSPNYIPPSLEIFAKGALRAIHMPFEFVSRVRAPALWRSAVFYIPTRKSSSSQGVRSQGCARSEFRAVGTQLGERNLKGVNQ